MRSTSSETKQIQLGELKLDYRSHEQNKEFNAKNSYRTLGGGILDKEDGRGIPVVGLRNPDEPEARALVRIKGGRKPERAVLLVGFGGPGAGPEAGPGPGVHTGADAEEGADAGASGLMPPNYKSNNIVLIYEVQNMN